MSKCCQEHPVEAVHNAHAALACVTDMLASGTEPIERDGLFTLLLSIEQRLRPAVDALQGYAPRT